MVKVNFKTPVLTVVTQLEAEFKIFHLIFYIISRISKIFKLML